MSDRTDLETRVAILFSTSLNIPTEEIDLNTDVFSSLGADSLNLLSLVSRLQREFGIRIQDADVSSVRSVGGTVDLLMSIRRLS